MPTSGQQRHLVMLLICLPASTSAVYLQLQQLCIGRSMCYFGSVTKHVSATSTHILRTMLDTLPHLM